MNGVIQKLGSIDFFYYGIIALKGIFVLLVGFLIAVVLKSIVLGLAEKLKAEKNYESLIKSGANFLYYFVIFLSVVAFLEVLGLKYITQPLLSFINKILIYLPNIVGAGLILLVGVFFARVSREFVKSFFHAFGLETALEKYGVKNSADITSGITYFLILLLVIVASLNALHIEAITQPAVNMINSIFLAVPKVAAALFVFALICYIGKLLADFVVGLLKDVDLESLISKLELPVEREKFESLIKYLILSFAVLIGFLQSFDYLEAKALYEITYNFIQILFKLIVASVVLIAGNYFGNLVGRKVEDEKIGILLKSSFILAAVLILLPYLGISPEVVKLLVFSLSLGVGVAFGLAFGLGGKEVAAQILRKLFLDKERSGNG